MTHVSPTSAPSPRNWMLPLLALGLVLAAWGAVFADEERVNQLDLSGWGTDLDIPERLAIDRYVARHYRPYIGAAVVLDGLASALLFWVGRRGRLGMFGVVVGVVWLLSTGWHSLNWLVTSFFATEGVRF